MFCTQHGSIENVELPETVNDLAIIVPLNVTVPAYLNSPSSNSAPLIMAPFSRLKPPLRTTITADLLMLGSLLQPQTSAFHLTRLLSALPPANSKYAMKDLGSVPSGGMSPSCHTDAHGTLTP